MLGIAFAVGPIWAEVVRLVYPELMKHDSQRYIETTSYYLTCKTSPSRGAFRRTNIVRRTWHRNAAPPRDHIWPSAATRSSAEEHNQSDFQTLNGTPLQR